MTSFTSKGHGDNVHWNLESILKGTASHESSSAFTVTALNGAAYSFTGQGLTYGSDGLPVSGTITGLTFSGSGQTAPFTVANAGISVADFMAALHANNPEAISAELFSGNDVFAAHGSMLNLDGFAGNDIFRVGHTLTANDKIDGGDGNDTVYLTGSHGTLDFHDTTIQNVENLFLSHSSYDIKLASGNVGIGGSLFVNGGHLHANQSLTLDASAITNGAVHVNGGHGNDTITGSQHSGDLLNGFGGDDTITSGNGDSIINGGNGNDTLAGGNGNDRIYSGAGIDHVSAGGGNDQIYFGTDFGTGDTVDGGAGNDTLHITEVGIPTLTLSAPMIQNVETLSLDTGSTGLTINFGANTSLTGPLTLDASSLTSGNALVADATNVVESTVDLIGGAGNDVLTGTTGNDILNGGGGTNILNGGGGSDTFVFNALDSTGSTVDTIVGFNALTDVLQLPNGVTGLDSSPLGIIASTVDGLLNLVGNTLGSHDAMVVQPILGLLSGNAFMLVDQNGVAGFQAGQDMIVELQNATHLGSLDLGNFLG
ncbi:MAG TPA: calcium-binding protein [Allosphingosinicella sp.]